MELVLPFARKIWQDQPYATIAAKDYINDIEIAKGVEVLLGNSKWLQFTDYFRIRTLFERRAQVLWWHFLTDRSNTQTSSVWPQISNRSLHTIVYTNASTILKSFPQDYWFQRKENCVRNIPRTLSLQRVRWVLRLATKVQLLTPIPQQNINDVVVGVPTRINR